VAVICQRAQEHIHADECILTYGYSKIVEQFLKAAGAKRKFQLIIAESSPGLDGHKLAQSLCKIPSISITLIPDNNIYAFMARVNKVHKHFFFIVVVFTVYDFSCRIVFESFLPPSLLNPLRNSLTSPY
jgi:hypothetical protein